MRRLIALLIGMGIIMIALQAAEQGTRVLGFFCGGLLILAAVTGMARNRNL